MFLANQHSDPKIGWRPIPAQRSIEIWSILQKHYPHISAHVGAIERVSGEYGSRNYRVVCGMPDGQHTCFLVHQDVLKCPEELHEGILLMEHLDSRGVRVPKIVATSHDDSFVRCQQSNWRVFLFIPGDHFAGTDDELTEAAQAIAAMHIALRAFPVKGDIRHIDDMIGPLDAAFWDDIARLRRENEFEMMLYRRASFIREHVIDAVEALVGITQAEEIIHGDLHPHNFLFPPDSDPAIIDFGVACRADQRYDIAMSCLRLCRQCVVHDGRLWQETLEMYVWLFLQVYASVTPLCDYCVRTLPVFGRAFLLRKMAYNLNLYMEGKKTAGACHRQFQRFFGFLDEIEAIGKILV